MQLQLKAICWKRACTWKFAHGRQSARGMNDLQPVAKR